MTAGLPNQGPVLSMRVGAGLTLSRNFFHFLTDALSSAWTFVAPLLDTLSYAEYHRGTRHGSRLRSGRFRRRSLYRQMAGQKA